MPTLGAVAESYRTYQINPTDYCSNLCAANEVKMEMQDMLMTQCQVESTLLTPNGGQPQETPQTLQTRGSDQSVTCPKNSVIQNLEALMSAFLSAALFIHKYTKYQHLTLT
jgi:hypothetical protein